MIMLMMIEWENPRGHSSSLDSVWADYFQGWLEFKWVTDWDDHVCKLAAQSLPTKKKDSQKDFACRVSAITAQQ